MLVLSRKTGQSIVIGNDIVVTIKEIRGKNVRIAIETPRQVPVHRMEIHQEIVEENKRAAAGSVEQLDNRLLLPKIIVERIPRQRGEGESK